MIISKRHQSVLETEQTKRFCGNDRRRMIIPQGWLDCPCFGLPIGFIVPSKAPLCDSYNEALPPAKTYTIKQLLSRTKNKLGLVVDLTNTTRYYNPNQELRREGVEYLKIPCTGHDSVPDELSVNTFVHAISQFQRRNLSNNHVLVHCTHGFNRTGFMIVHYLMRSKPGITVTQALKMFSDARSPGIYKPDYIEALYRFYNETKPTSLICPSTPTWKMSENKLRDASVFSKGDNKNQQGKKMTNDDVLGAEIPYKQERYYQEFCYDMLKIGTGRGRSLQFPGSHPVSLDREGLLLLRQRYYYVTWKADGTRYMMLLTREGCYLIDRRFRFRRVQMRFPCMDDPSNLHHYTLLDGEMVVDTYTDGGRLCQKRRYLVYDLVALNGISVTEWPFSKRLSTLAREVIKPREEEKMKVRVYRYEFEPFGVRTKGFCLLSALERKVLKDLIPKLTHKTDGLIFQAWDDPYVTRTNHALLKWKSAEQNSIDFLVEIGGDGSLMLFLHEHGRKKFMEGYRVELRGHGWGSASSYSGKLLECSWDSDKGVWVGMRVRGDKSTPNDINIANKVMKSISDNITQEVLLDEIKEIIGLPMYVDRIRMDIQASEQQKRHGNR